MAKFQIVEIPEAPYASRWTIEEVIPGEKPIPVTFFGTRGAAEAEARRLALYGKGTDAAATKLPERGRVK
jgi:hypothetical protein